MNTFRRTALPSIPIGLVLVLALLWTVPAAAQVEGAIRLHTPFPGVITEPGTSLDFDVDVTADVALIADVTVEDVPDGWETSVTGGGSRLDQVSVTPDGSTEITVSFTLPADTPEGRYQPSVVVGSGAVRTILPLSVRVEAGAAGTLSVETDLPGQRATAGDTVDFDLTVRNTTPVDAEVALDIDGPQGWRLDITPAQDAQATDFIVRSNANADVDVRVVAPQSTPAGEYTVVAHLSSGDWSAEVPLLVAITGSYGMNLTTSGDRLNAEVTIGSSSTLDLIVANTGTAPLDDVELSARAPSGWTVEFDQSTIDTVASGATAVVVATITPADDAIAGDYVIDFTADHEEVSASTIQIRTSVSPSPLWGWIGVGLIAATIVLLLVVFRRFGRR